jgi:hypothetical protein
MFSTHLMLDKQWPRVRGVSHTNLTGPSLLFKSMQMISWETGNGEGFTAPRKGLQAQTRILLHTGTSLLLMCFQLLGVNAPHATP